VDPHRHRLGRSIRRARLFRELTQSELAGAVGVGLSTVERWEAGTSSPSLLALGPLCDALRVPAEYFRRAPVEDVDRLLVE
jgi:transcriptional regulator with XRE-family HTH domain